MLTRLRLRGWKSFLEEEVWLGPFTCVVGENGVGKSNLFDAIRFLHLLARGLPFHEAAQLLRPATGRPASLSGLFTRLGDRREPTLELEADLVVPGPVVDDFGNPVANHTTAVRYRVVLELADDGDDVRLVSEDLLPVSKREARAAIVRMSSKVLADSIVRGPDRRAPFLSSERGIVRLHQEHHQGRLRQIPIGRSQRTVLGEASTTEFPTVLAARREMESWRTLLLEPSAMRSPSAYRDPSVIDERGAFVAATLYRLTRDDEAGVLARIANRLHRLLPEVHRVRVEDDPRTEMRTVGVLMRDGGWVPARSLSDGTLRFLVLAVLAEDTSAPGLLCFEEPENGIHPERIAAIVELLTDLAVEPGGAAGTGNPLRQVIANTHSPLVYRCVDDRDHVWFVSRSVGKGDDVGMVTAVEVPRGSWRADLPGARFVPPGDAARWKQMSFDFEHAAEE